jgi:ferredoxin-nitrate reductase
LNDGTEIFKSTCSYCGVGCGIEVLKHPDGQLELRGDASHPANRGMLCSKGRSLLHTVNARSTRLHFPVMRKARGESRERVSWEEAIGHVAAEFKRIVAQHGPDAVACYVSGQCLTEEYYLANKIAKGFLQTNNIDTNSRLCMSSAVCGYKATLGADGPPTSYEDVELTDTFLVAGANPAWCHPVLFRRMEARKMADSRVKLIVVDPRRTASAQVADLHLQIRPGTDVALFLGIARRLAHMGSVDHMFMERHVEGGAEFLESCEAWTLAHTAEVCGVMEKEIALAAEWIGGDRKFLSMWAMGLNQSAAGTDKNVSLIALSLIMGKIGKPGCGPFSLTGQPNAMGGREVGGMATLLPGHRDLTNAAHRAEVAKFWGVESIPEKPGLTAVELFDAIGAGMVKAVWVIATNPVASMPNAWQVEKSLAAAELVVVQDIYPTETTELADVVLPAAGWLEKAGTMTNSDRTMALLEKAVEPPGEALADVEILLRFACAMGWKGFGYGDVGDVFAEHAALTEGTDVDIGGLTHGMLRAQGPVQWPARKGREESGGAGLPSEAKGTTRLYTDFRFPTATGKARLRGMEHVERSEAVTAEFPLVLTTGRIREQWHTMTKTGLVNRLATHVDSPFCEIHPADAATRGIVDGEIVTVRNGRGEVRVRAAVTEDIRRGVVFLPMHWGKKLGGERGRANNVTSARVDPVSKEPDLKLAAVEVEKFVPVGGAGGKRRIVIVGAGSAALAFVEAHRRYNTRDEIVMLGGESLPVYNRVMLPHYIDGSAAWETLVRANGETLNPNRVILHSNTLVSRIDRAAKVVVDARGRAFGYDVLVLATGSRPAVHYDGPVPEHGTFTLRSRRDADAIVAAARGLAGESRHAVIHGGGLLAVELADALRHLGCSVTIVQRSDRLMGKQLDAAAAGHLAEEMALRGIDVRFCTSIVEVVGGDHATGVRLYTAGTGETTVACDLVVFATGTVPNKELAGAAGLDCDRGVWVNRFMQTSDPAIFAIGECAEFEGQTVGTTPGAEAHARALAEFLRGNEHAAYRQLVTANIVKVRGMSLAAAGTTDPPTEDASYETIVLHDARRRFYQKCVVKDDRLVGAICMGDTARFSQYLEWISSGLELESLRAELLRGGAGIVGKALDGAMICSCHHVGSGTIEKAAATCGGDLHKVCAATKAGTGCGSCKPEIFAILKRLTQKALHENSQGESAQARQHEGLDPVKGVVSTSVA